MSDKTKLEQHQGEPVAVLYANGTVLTKADCGDVFDICCKVETPLYPHPAPADPGEVERLRAEVAKFRGYCVDLDSEKRELEHKMDAYKGAAQEAATLRAQLAEAQALLREADEFMYIMTAHDGHAKLAHRYGKDWWDAIDKLRGKVCTALSASAEPKEN